METQDSLDIRALQQLILGPIPEPANPLGARDVQTTCEGVAAGDDGPKLDDVIYDTADPKQTACGSNSGQKCSDHDNTGARAQSLQVTCPEAVSEKAVGAQSLPLPKRMSTQGSEEKTQEFGEEELAELVKKVQEDHAQRSSGSDEDEPGHIDLLKSFEQSHVDRYDAEEDNDDDFGGQSQVHAEMFPESRRFQHPTTPATIRKKQNHSADAVTPGLPANPFSKHGVGSTEVVPMSQLFKYTQPSSPHRKTIQSDPASEFPSPAVFGAFRSPILPTSSSPTNITTVTKNQAPTESRAAGVATEGPKRQKARRARSSPLTKGKGDEGSSDDGFDSSAERLMIWRKREKQKIEEETRKQFEMVKAPSRVAVNAKGKRRGKDKTQDGGTKNKNRKFPLVPNDTGKTLAIEDGDTTEGESDDVTIREKSRGAKAQPTKPPAVLDEQHVTIGQRALSTYRQRQPPEGHLEDEPTIISSSEQSTPVEGGGVAASQSQGASLGVVRVVEVENSQPSLSQVKPGEAQRVGVSTLPSLPSSIGSGFLVSRSQDDDLPLPPRVNQSLINESSVQNSNLPQPLSSPSAQGDLSRSQGPSLFHRNSNSHSQSQVLDGIPQNLAKQQAVIECSSPQLPTAAKLTDHGGSGLGDVVVENSEPMEELAFPLQTVNESNVGIYGMRTPITTKPPFSANETTIPETSPAVGRISRLPLHEHLNRTPQQSPIPPPKDGKSWSQGNTVGEQYTIQSSNSNLFETARSQLSSPQTGPMNGINESNNSSRQVNDNEGSRNRTLIAGLTPSHRLSEGVDVIMGNSQQVGNDLPQKNTPAYKRRKGARGRVIPETGTKTRLPVAIGKAAKTSEDRVEHTIATEDQNTVLDCAPTVGMDEGKLVGTIEKAEASSKGVEVSNDRRPGAGPKAGEASKKAPAPKTAVSGKMTSRSLRTGGASPQTTSPTDPKQKSRSIATVAELGPDPEIIEPNRVLALFKNGNMSYYPATCRFIIGVDNPGFKVRFDDGTEDILDSQNVRRFDLRVGDIVKVDLNNMRMKNYIVCGFQDRKDKGDSLTSPRRNRADPQGYPTTDIHGYSTILLQQKQRDSLPNEGSSFSGEQICVPISSIYILKTMWHKFSDRIYIHASDLSRPGSRAQTSGGLRSNPVTPTRGRRMTPAVLAQTGNSDALGVPSGFTSGIFRGMVFAVTYLKQDRDKEQIVKQIIENGGKILEDGFEELFQPDWFVETSGDPHSFRLKRDAEKLGFACVIANVHSRKPKFLGALALGLPCLHGRWIKDCTKKNEIVDWDPYLLPSGESSYLGGSTRSRVLLPYSPLTAQLPNTIASRPKTLEGQSIILVMGRSKAEDRRKAFLFLVFALGASKVHQVPNIEAARRHLADAERNEENWDWVCVNDKDAKKALSGGGATSGRKRKREDEDMESEVGFPRVKIMSDDHVMQTVVMGRLMAEV
ncbi:MAG: hypothetical protein M1839_002779 [Geoglossum umbratile]|nr:MAG: hypothetical protein M1839_002779 [Geoglossum umbratile]